MDNKEKIKRSFIIVVIMIIAVVSIVSARERRAKKQEEKQNEINENGNGTNNNVVLTGNYNVDLIKKFHEVGNNKNYLISPYNIELGLNMLRDGADGKTKEELDKLLGNRTINDVSVKDKIGIANGVFIRDIYKDNVKQEYYNILNTKYKSDIIYDPFDTPEKINNWVNEKTNGMIPKLLNQISKDYVMGLASALAIDVKWLSGFECNSTGGEEFTKLNNEKINVEMMHKTYKDTNYRYFENDDANGIIIPYQKEENSNIQLEFVGILPNNSIDDYIKNLTKEKIDNIDNNLKYASEKLHINLSLPRFKYDYEASDDFIKVLKGLGINEAFNPNTANFKKMIEIEENVYVGEAIHKTHVELNEVGTKAAAITYFGMFKNSAVMEPEKFETIDIRFDKPFMYMIREANTKEILFFGSVYEPNTWKGSTCDNK